MWEDVKLALGLLLHCSSRVDFKGRQKLKQLTAVGAVDFTAPPAEMVHIEKRAVLEIYDRNLCSVTVKRLIIPPLILLLNLNSCTCQEKALLTSSHSAVKEGVLSSLPPGLAPSPGFGLPGPWPRDPEPQLCSSWTRQNPNCFRA